jgi:hypothetical protein
MRIARFIIVRSYKYSLPHLTLHFQLVPPVSDVLSAKAVARMHFAFNFLMSVYSRAAFLIPFGVVSRARGKALVSTARRCGVAFYALSLMCCPYSSDAFVPSMSLTSSLLVSAFFIQHLFL